MDKSEKFWDKRAKKFDKRSKRFGQTYRRIVASTNGHLNRSDTVLDYACGTGLATVQLADKVKEIHGVDISSRMIEVANAKTDKLKNVSFAQATIFDASYKAESFDVISAFNILHLLEDRQKELSRIVQLLKKGGRFISATPCLGEKKNFLSLILPALMKIGIAPYIKMFKISELEDLIVNSNFQIIASETLHLAPLEYFIVAKKI